VKASAPLTGVLLAVVLAIAFGAYAVPVAHAEFGPIQLISKSAKEQADEAFAPAISADGRYVVFAGRLGGRFGVFRKDLQTGAVALVTALSSGEAAREANPSVSADGRYVAFTTFAQLDPKNDLVAGSTDVYVADMNATPPTYEIASALDGCDPVTEAPCGLSYGGPGGAISAPRVALSADGRSVAFLIKVKSNLLGDPTKLETPAGQVAVRELASHETILITQRRGGPVPEAVPGGGAATASEGAAISGDGSTVAWVGRRLPAQVPMLADEEATVRSYEGEAPSSVANEYHEPLWRRVPTALEPNPPTRRVVGGGDPDAPGCPPGGTLADPACQGPFPNIAKGRVVHGLEENEGPGWGLGLPQLSRDGNTVAFVGNPDEGQDLFVVDMAPGLSRRQAVRRLTQWVNLAPGAHEPGEAFAEKFKPFSGRVFECAISPDGNRIAFTTARQVFPLAPPSLVTPPPTGPAFAELYQLDLTGETIERVTPGGSGGSSTGDSSSPSYDENGGLLAFSSLASNLVAGDANEAKDAFVVESPLPRPVDESAITRRPAALVVTPLWRMTVDAASLPDGRVRVTAGLPGRGTLNAEAAARLGRRLKLRRVASASRLASAAGVQRFDLRLPRKLRGLAHKKGGLYAQLDVDFSGPGGKPLRAALDVRFLVHRKKVKR
jgi:hypothetical protein